MIERDSGKRSSLNETLVKGFVVVLSDYCHRSTTDKEPIGGASRTKGATL